MSADGDAASGATSGVDGGADVQADLEIVNEKGLHARASARFAAVVEQYDAEVTVTRQDLTVSGESIMGLLMLVASKGSTIQLCAKGPQAEAAVTALRDLVADKFGEGE